MSVIQEGSVLFAGDLKSIDKRKKPLHSAVLTALALIGASYPTVVLCQSTIPVAETEVSKIVVTSSRISRNGFEAPTPVTVLGGEELEKRGLTNIGALLNELPAFRASQSPTQNTSTSTGAGFTFADLRGLGSQRTLVLLDNRRHVPTANTGQVDLNLIPSILIDRVEVVTGGASAAWGSDAVAGVVNLILKKNLRGLVGNVSAGMSQEHDNKESHFGFAGGSTFADGKGHVVGGVEFVKNDGIGDATSRSWARQDYGIATNPTPGAGGNPARIIGPNFYQAGLVAGGIVTSGPLKGTTFGPGGTPSAFQYGQVFGTGMFGPGTTGLTQQYSVLWKVPVERYNGLVSGDYQLTENTSAFVQAGFGVSDSKNVNGYARDAALTIRQDNAFLPASTRQAMINNNLQTISVGRYDIDLPGLRPEAKSSTARIVVGLDGQFAEKWPWNAYYQYGQNDYHVNIPNNRINANWNAAIDAISVNGVIACRNPSLVTNSVLAAPGCVPFNIFGQGSASPAAVAYVMGNGWGELLDAVFTDPHAFGQ